METQVKILIENSSVTAEAVARLDSIQIGTFKTEVTDAVKSLQALVQQLQTRADAT